MQEAEGEIYARSVFLWGFAFSLQNFVEINLQPCFANFPTLCFLRTLFTVKLILFMKKKTNKKKAKKTDADFLPFLDTLRGNIIFSLFHTCKLVQK